MERLRFRAYVIPEAPGKIESEELIARTFANRLATGINTQEIDQLRNNINSPQSQKEKEQF